MILFVIGGIIGGIVGIVVGRAAATAHRSNLRKSDGPSHEYDAPDVVDFNCVESYDGSSDGGGFDGGGGGD